MKLVPVLIVLNNKQIVLFNVMKHGVLVQHITKNKYPTQIPHNAGAVGSGGWSILGIVSKCVNKHGQVQNMLFCFITIRKQYPICPKSLSLSVGDGPYVG